MEDLSGYRRVFAGFVARRAGIAAESEIVEAFASTPRERFVGGPPWRISADNGRYFEVPGEYPSFLYQDMPVCLDQDGNRNNGQPSLHALCLDALALKRGETVVHVGAGTGYYTTLLAKLVGEEGSVDAYEIDPALAQRATENLAEFLNVKVHCVSGAEGQLPGCDILYVNAGATAPMAALGAAPAVSSNGSENGIVWVLATKLWNESFTDKPAVLHAYEAANLAHELYNSEQRSERDRAGMTVRFAVPTVADGRVFVGTRGRLDVYGLLGTP